MDTPPPRISGNLLSGSWLAPDVHESEATLATCDVCGKDYDKSFEIRRGPVTYTFDCFECAIHRLAPQCAHCACRVIGHGVESEGQIYCRASWARNHALT